MTAQPNTFGTILPLNFGDKDISDEKIALINQKIQEADAVVVGIASGMSSAGASDPYNGNDHDPLFDEYLGTFAKKLGIKSWFNGFYHRFRNAGQRQAYIAAMCEMLYHTPVQQQYWDLKELLQGKDFFVVTTNQDQIARKVFGDENVAWIQGDWGWYQCGHRCSDEVYPAHEAYTRMMEQTVDCEIPTEAIPTCPHCGAQIEPWVRGYEFLEGSLYRDQYRKYNGYLRDHIKKNVLFLELGVGAMTPMFIKEPFWNYVYGWEGEAFYIPVTIDHAVAPREIRNSSLCFDADIAYVMHRAAELKRGESFDTQDDSFKVECKLSFPGGTGVAGVESAGKIHAIA